MHIDINYLQLASSKTLTKGFLGIELVSDACICDGKLVVTIVCACRVVAVDLKQNAALEHVDGFFVSESHAYVCMYVCMHACRISCSHA